MSHLYFLLSIFIFRVVILYFYKLYIIKRLRMKNKLSPTNNPQFCSLETTILHLPGKFSCLYLPISKYSHALYNNILLNNRLRIRQWSHKISTVQPRCAVGCTIQVCVSTLYDVRTTMKSSNCAFLRTYPCRLSTYDCIGNENYSQGHHED